MFDDLMNYFSGNTGVYGTNPGISYNPDSFAWGLPDDYTGSGLRLTGMPSGEGLNVPPADIQSPSVNQLAKGASNLPKHLGSNDPNLNPPNKDANRAMLMAGVGLLGASMNRPRMGQGSGRMPEAWGASYSPRSFCGAAPFPGGSNPYSPTTFKDMLRRRMVQMQPVTTGLLG